MGEYSDLEYGDMHRVFLQGMMSRCVLDFRQVNELLSAALDHCDDEHFRFPDKKEEKRNFLSKLISDINGKLSELNLQIKKGLDEDDGSNFFILANLSKRTKELARIQTQFNAEEFDYIELLVREILNTDHKFISSKAALNLCLDMELVNGKRINMTQADTCIYKLLQGKWLKDVHGGKLALGVRFLTEMDDYIRDYLDGEYEVCGACRKVVSRGCRCEGEGCDTIYHRHCGQKMAKKRGDNRFKCIKCPELIEAEIYVDPALIAVEGPFVPGPTAKEIGDRIRVGLEEAEREIYGDEETSSQEGETYPNTETEDESEMSERRDTTSQDESDHHTDNDTFNRRKRKRIVTSQDSSDNEMDD